jgi:hypothetical protein
MSFVFKVQHDLFVFISIYLTLPFLEEKSINTFYIKDEGMISFFIENILKYEEL